MTKTECKVVTNNKATSGWRLWKTNASEIPFLLMDMYMYVSKFEKRGNFVHLPKFAIQTLITLQ